MDLFHHAISLTVLDRPLTWTAVHDDRILVVHGWGMASAIGMEIYSFAGEQLGRVPSVRADVCGAVFPDAGWTTGFLLGNKRLIVLDLAASKVVGRHALGDVFPRASYGNVVLLSTAKELRFERISVTGSERFARMRTEDAIRGAEAVSATRWWVWSKRRLLLIEVHEGAATVVSTHDFPFGADQILVDPLRDIAVVMDTSVGLTGSTACSLRLSDAHVTSRAGVPTGRIVWDEGGRTAILDEKENRIHRLGADLNVQEVIPSPPLGTQQFPVRAVQVSPAEVLVCLAPARGSSSLLHLAWGEGAERAADRRARASVRS